MLRKGPAQRGFTLLELMVVTAIVGILASIAIPSFMKYIKKSKSTEARTQLSKIYNGARTYYYEEIAASTKIDVVNPQFPGDNAKTPAVSCCTATGERCAPDDSLWRTPTWEALKFGVPDPHYYQYRFESEGEGIGANFTAFAYGNLDCDAQFSTFLMWGKIDDVGGDPVLSAATSRKFELE